MKINPGRLSVEIEGDFVVFLIGMRINKWWKVHKWLPLILGMLRMQKVLTQHPERGCLAFHNWYGRTTMCVQYWRSFEDLERFARDKSLPHLQPWRDFNRAVRDSGDVGIYHETYKAGPGTFEAFYGNMPPFGLARAGMNAPAQSVGNTAGYRLGQTTKDEPAVEAY